MLYPIVQVRHQDLQSISRNVHGSITSFNAILALRQYTPKECAEIVALCIENNRSVVKTVRASKKYAKRSAPSVNTIRSLGKNFFGYGSIATHQRSKLSGEVVETVRADNPNMSYRRESQELSVCGTTPRRIMKQSPTYSKVVANGQAARMIDFWNKTLMSNETHFTL